MSITRTDTSVFIKDASEDTLIVGTAGDPQNRWVDFTTDRGGVPVVDAQGRKYTPDMTNSGYTSDRGPCGDIQPGLTDPYVLLFEVPKGGDLKDEAVEAALVEAGEHEAELRSLAGIPAAGEGA